MNVVTCNEVTSDGKPRLQQAPVDGEEEQLLECFQDVAIHVPEDADDAPSLPFNHTNGTLSVTSTRVVWVASGRSSSRVGYGWEMRMITLHAISRDTSAFPQACLYCQLDGEATSEVRFVPSNSAALPAMYAAFSKAAEMNPDEDDEENGDYMMIDGEECPVDGDGWIYNHEEVENGARAAVIAARLDSILQVSPALQHPAPVSGQFDDAEEEHDDLL